MSVTKHIEDAGDSRPVRYVVVCCDFCGNTIATYHGNAKQAARRWAKAEGATLSDDKDFCNDNCFWKYQDQQAAAARDGGNV
jgi:hypothetical protein